MQRSLFLFIFYIQITEKLIGKINEMKDIYTQSVMLLCKTSCEIKIFSYVIQILCIKIISFVEWNCGIKLQKFLI